MLRMIARGFPLPTLLSALPLLTHICLKPSWNRDTIVSLSSSFMAASCCVNTLRPR